MLELRESGAVIARAAGGAEGGCSLANLQVQGGGPLRHAGGGHHGCRGGSGLQLVTGSDDLPGTGGTEAMTEDQTGRQARAWPIRPSAGGGGIGCRMATAIVHQQGGGIECSEGVACGRGGWRAVGEGEHRMTGGQAADGHTGRVWRGVRDDNGGSTFSEGQSEFQQSCGGG